MLTACGGTSDGSTTSTTSATTPAATTTAADPATTSGTGTAATGMGTTAVTPPASGTSSSTSVGTSTLLAPTTTAATTAATTTAAAAATTTAATTTTAAATTTATTANSSSAPAPSKTTAAVTSSSTLSIKVSGNHLEDGNGNAIQLRGANAGNLEAQPFLAPLNWWREQGAEPNFSAMATLWGINVVRLPLGEQNWLGLCASTVSGGGTAANFQAVVKQAVADANAAGLYVILDLHFLGSPNSCPSGQQPMADTAYSPTFWSQVAAAFKNNPAVMFELFNEPQGNYPPTTADWNNYVNGGLTGPQDVGTQALLTAIRSTGATNVVLVDGLDYAATFGNNNNPNIGTDQPPGFILPTDTLNPAQLAAAQHYYNGSGYETGANAVLAKGIPILVTEYGDDVNATSDPDTLSLYGWADPGGRASQALTAAGQNGAAFPGVSYVAWVWNWGGGWYGGQGYNNWSLIQNANGALFSPSADPALNDSSTTPTAYAAEVNSHYLCRAAGTANCP
jgi:endoglucanase